MDNPEDDIIEETTSTTILGNQTNEEELANLRIFYIFYPIFVTMTIIIWAMTISGLFSWITGLFLTTFIFIILYGFSILYRTQIESLNTCAKNTKKKNKKNNFSKKAE